MSTTAFTMFMQHDKAPQKPFLYLSKRALLWSMSTATVGLAMLSVVQLAHKASSRNMWIDTNLINYQSIFVLYTDGVMEVPQFGFTYFQHGDALMFASAAICLATSLNTAIMVFHAAKKGLWNTIFWISVALRAALFLSCVIAVTAFIYIFALHGASAEFNPDLQRSKAIPQPCPEDLYLPCPQPRVDYVYPGTFDRETWFCQFAFFPRFTVDRRFDSAPDVSWHKQICALETGARWTSIFVVAFSTILCFLFYMDWKGDRHLMRTWKKRGQDWCDDGEELQ
ncbi:hypothetical protein BR93DRAFT_981138 [Coniochaeta sp. PMI_546]|nr:hypothetical protein BR93DRAFT_981138 [Coniochaeta sp. PMI_546]